MTAPHLLPIGTKVEATRDLLQHTAWGLDAPPAGVVVGHLNGYNQVDLHRPDGSTIVAVFESSPFWLAENSELIILDDDGVYPYPF